MDLLYYERATGGHLGVLNAYNTPEVYDWMFSHTTAVPEPIQKSEHHRENDDDIQDGPNRSCMATKRLTSQSRSRSTIKIANIEPRHQRSTSSFFASRPSAALPCVARQAPAYPTGSRRRLTFQYIAKGFFSDPGDLRREGAHWPLGHRARPVTRKQCVFREVPPAFCPRQRKLSAVSDLV